MKYNIGDIIKFNAWREDGQTQYVCVGEIVKILNDTCFGVISNDLDEHNCLVTAKFCNINGINKKYISKKRCMVFYENIIGAENLWRPQSKYWDGWNISSEL